MVHWKGFVLCRGEARPIFIAGVLGEVGESCFGDESGLLPIGILLILRKHKDVLVVGGSHCIHWAWEYAFERPSCLNIANSDRIQGRLDWVVGDKVYGSIVHFRTCDSDPA